MARFSHAVRDLTSKPLILASVLDRFVEEAAELPATSRPGIKSSILYAVRHALRTGDREEDLAPKEVALAADIRDLVPSLHVHARGAAMLRTHQDCSDAEARAHRFVHWLTGGRRYDEHARVDWPCPTAFQPLIAFSNRSNVRGELGFLYRCCTVAGIAEAPARFPTYPLLLAAAAAMNAPVRAGARADRDAADRARDRVASALSCYRLAREGLLAAAPEAERAALRARFAPCPQPVVGRAVHIGAHEETDCALRAVGLVPEEMLPFEKLRAITPCLAEDFEFWAAGAGALQSESFREQCEDALIRVGGWAVSAGRLAEFQRAEGIDDLFAMRLETGVQARVTPRAARRGEKTGGTRVERVSLLELLADAAAPGSLERSTVAAEDVPLNKDGRPYFTHGVYATCNRLWSVARDIYAGSANQNAEDAHRWALATAGWGHLVKELKDRQLPGEYIIRAKDKPKLIALVTLPQLVCLAFPMRRRELRAMRATWQQLRAEAVEKGHDPERHPDVVVARDEYLVNAVRHTMLAITLDDGMRHKQYQRGRLGYQRNFRPAWRYDGGRIVGLEGMTTWWTGERSDPANFKIRERKGKVDTRPGFELHPGYVPMDILWDIIALHRPRQLVAAGLVPSLDAYDLEDDMRRGEWALFPSDVLVKREENSRTDMSKQVGRELHYLVKLFLRPTDEKLPAWEALDDSWRALWSQHVTRLLNTSYWGGIRRDWDRACRLSKDTEATLREEYTIVDVALRDKLRNDSSDWQHPKAYDSWMDRLYDRFEVFDPLDDPTLPLPAHLAEQLAAERMKARRLRPRAAGPRLRQARPGQAPPQRARNARCVTR